MPRMARGSAGGRGRHRAPHGPVVRGVSPAVAAIVAAAVLGSCTTAGSAGTPGDPTSTTALETSTTTLSTTASPPAAPGGATVDQLVVAPESDADSYDRELFGDGWIDADGDGCDTRREVLIAESMSPAQVDPFGCEVIAGDWLSAYDGYATDDPTELEIDHVVALAEAWRSGAAGWTDERRQAFANDLDDPGALIGVTAATNRSKGDRDPASWQPPDREAWCDFAGAWVTVKAGWELTADQAEVDALRNMLVGC